MHGEALAKHHWNQISELNFMDLFKVTIHTLLHLKYTTLVSVRSSLPCINIRVHIKLSLKKNKKKTLL